MVFETYYRSHGYPKGTLQGYPKGRAFITTENCKFPHSLKFRAAHRSPAHSMDVTISRPGKNHA